MNNLGLPNRFLHPAPEGDIAALPENAVDKPKSPAEILFIKNIGGGNLYEALLIFENNNLSRDLIIEPETLAKINESIARDLSNPEQGIGALGLIDAYGLENHKKDIIKKAIESSLRRMDRNSYSSKPDINYDYIASLKQQAEINDEEFTMIITQFVQNTLINHVSIWEEVIKKLEEHHFINHDQVVAVAPQAVKVCLEKGKPEYAAAIVKNLLGENGAVGQEELMRAGEAKILNEIKGASYMSIYIIEDTQKEYLIPDDFFKSTEVQKALQDRYIKELQEARIKTALEMVEKFSIDIAGIDQSVLEEARVRCLENCQYKMLYSKDAKDFYGNYEYLREVAESIGYKNDPFELLKLRVRAKDYINSQIRQGENSQKVKKLIELYNIDNNFISSFASDKAKDILLDKDEKGQFKFRTEPPTRMLQDLDSLGADYTYLVDDPDFIYAIDRYIQHGWSGGMNDPYIAPVVFLYKKGLINDEYISTRKRTIEEILNRELSTLGWRRDEFESEVNYLMEIKKLFKVEDLSSGEQEMIKRLAKDKKFANIRWLKEHVGITDVKITTAVVDALDELMARSLTENFDKYLSEMIVIKHEFDTPYNLIADQVNKRIESNVDKFSINKLVKLRMGLSMSKSDFEDVLDIYVKKVFEKDLPSYGTTTDLDQKLEQVKRKLAPLGPELDIKVHEFLVNKLSKLVIEFEYHGSSKNTLNSDVTQEYIKKYNLGADDIQQAILITLIDLASYNNMDGVAEMIEMFEVDKEISNHPKVIQGFYQHVVTEIDRNNDVDGIISLGNKIGIVFEPQKIVEKVPRIKTFQERLFKQYPNFPKTFPASMEEVIMAAQLSKDTSFWNTIDNYPFLGDTIIANPKFSRKLITYFHNFDDLSKENIALLYEIKKTILQEYPDMDQGSAEFRERMQKDLYIHKENSVILQGLQDKGVRLDQWLDYDAEISFTLGKEQKVRFGDVARTPVERIGETISKYTGVVKEGLRHYQSELQSAQVVVDDILELDKKIESMRIELEKATGAHNPLKVAGIEKGIASLLSKKENPKQIAVWVKLTNDLAALIQAGNKVIELQNTIIKIEDESAKVEVFDLPMREKRKELHKFKEKLGALQEEFKKEINTLELRMDKFQKQLPELLIPAIGSERTGSVMQEVGQETQEVLDHYQSDYSTLRRLFSEQSGDSVKLEGRPMRVELWSRNPDTDLYLGNYTDCCIRIDSTHMGSESTIADYLTDVGMQVVKVVDEKTDEPIVAAWLFVGEDQQGNPALVIDNIEANTDYSEKFRSQLQQQVKDYIREYAKSSGINKIVQGQSNNDLVIYGMDGEYTKLGGYNRSDGYYLEGEGDLDDDDENDGDDDEDYDDRRYEEDDE
jgi:hypothetical protein